MDDLGSEYLKIAASWLAANLLPKPPITNHLRAQMVFDFSDYRKGLTIKQLSVGAERDPLIWLDNIEFEKHAMEFRTYYQELVDSGKAKHKVVHLCKDEVREVLIPQIPRASVVVQPFTDIGYLVAATRCMKDELNAWIVNCHGEVVSKFRLGDAIECFQVTKQGKIWLGYFDEGVYGDDPLSKLGFSCFDQAGNLLYPSSKAETLGRMARGLNVESEDTVWLSPLDSDGWYKLIDYEIAETFKRDPENVSGDFAVFHNLTCWAPDLPCIFSHSSRFTLFDLATSQESHFNLVDDHSRVIKPTLCAGRGSDLFVLEGSKLYLIDLRQFVENTQKTGKMPFVDAR